MSKEGAVKICDFGIAKILGSSRSTKIGDTKGTSGYLSPEQAKGLELDARSDLFSVGIVLWELLAGVPLFSGTPEEKAAKLLGKEIPPPSKFNKEVSNDLEQVILRTLEHDRDWRIGSAVELAKELKQLLAGFPVEQWGRSAISRLVCQHYVPPTTMGRPIGETNKVPEKAESSTAGSSSPQPAVVERSRVVPILLALVGVLLSVLIVFAANQWQGSQKEKENQTTVPQTQTTPGEKKPGPVIEEGVIKEEKPKPANYGYLNLRSKPWSTVFLGDRELGETPLLRIKLPVGYHNLKLVNRPAGLSETVRVRIFQNKTTERKIFLK